MVYTVLSSQLNPKLILLWFILCYLLSLESLRLYCPPPHSLGSGFSLRLKTTFNKLTGKDYVETIKTTFTRLTGEDDVETIKTTFNRLTRKDDVKTISWHIIDLR